MGRQRDFAQLLFTPALLDHRSRSRIRQILSALNVAVHPADLNIPGFDFHELKGDRKGTFAVKVTGNWRVTFQWVDDGPFAVDLEDYHGK